MMEHLWRWETNVWLTKIDGHPVCITMRYNCQPDVTVESVSFFYHQKWRYFWSFPFHNSIRAQSVKQANLGLMIKEHIMSLDNDEMERLL